MSQNARMVPSWIQDQTGRIKVDPAGASIEGVQVIDQFQPEDLRRPQQALSLGSFAFQLDTRSITDNRRTLGYRFREVILPLEQNIYILGSANEASGELTIQKPREKGQKFIISVKSEEELLASSRSTMKWLQIGAIGCMGLGLILLIMSLVA